MWENAPVWSVYIIPHLSLGYMMAANIEWSSVFLSLTSSSMVVYFYSFVDQMFFILVQVA